MPFEEHRWFIERTSATTAHMFGVSRFICSVKTAYQQVEIADTDMYGRILVLDGKIQSAENDEYVYHEALVHPAMLLNPDPKKILVIGGGEGATLREVFRHPGVEKLVMVDLDQEVVDLCRVHLDKWHRGSFDDGRLKLVFTDAREYLENCEESFDVIISDVPEPLEGGPALKLFSRQYFGLIKNRLNSGGVLSMQAGDYGLPFVEAHSAIYKTVGSVMPFTRSYHTFVSSFNTEWGFVVAGPDPAELPRPEYFDRLISERKLQLKFFDGITAAGMFSSPLDIRRRLEAETRVIDDRHLLATY